MKTKLVEGVSPGGLYLKAMVGYFDQEDWARKSQVTEVFDGSDISLLRQEGWGADHFMVLDVSRPGPGRIFKMGGDPKVDVLHGPAEF